MINYVLLISSIILFLIGIRYGIRNGINTKRKSFFISLLVTCFFSFSFLFIAADYISGNGFNKDVIYFLRDTFTSLSFWGYFLRIAFVISIGIAIFISARAVINRIDIKAASKEKKGNNYVVVFYIFVMLSFISSPVTFGILNNFYLSKSSENRDEVQNMKSRHDVDRFIAHAGGKIDGNVYTNSLEALDLNYEKGFRLFELDFLKTADGVYVAAHEWEHWQDMTGYKGVLPPEKAAFKQFKILGKYTPLDIDDINVWFKDHPDAILVTDKINTPTDFSKSFIDKERLIMELFTLEAVQEAVDAGIKSAMPNWAVVSGIKGDKVQTLVDMGVTEIAASRRDIKYNIQLIKSFKRNGIKIYVFHVNYEEGKDEDYVVRYDMDYIYGLYADEFDLCISTTEKQGNHLKN